MLAKIYAELIRKGLKTIDDVPEGLRAAVEELVRRVDVPEGFAIYHEHVE